MVYLYDNTENIINQYHIMKRILAVLACIVTAVCADAAVAVNLRCEYLTSPLGIDNAHPLLSWQMKSNSRNAMQTAWQVMVASTPELLASDKPDLWDSGRREGSGIAVEYAGERLESFSRCYWKVRIWDEKGKASAWSRTAEWAMGAISAEDWAPARWISAKPDGLWCEEWQQRKAAEKAVEKLDWPLYNGMGMTIWDIAEMTKPAYDPSPLMRKDFEVKAEAVRAMLYVTGLGYYEAFINGERVGDQVLDPGWTYYNKHTSYEAFDVLPMLKSGKNAIGMMIGRGQYNPLSNDIWRLCKSEWVGQPKAIALLRIEYSDGSVSTVGTDGSWRTTGGPLIYDDTRLGEIYDGVISGVTEWGFFVELDDSHCEGLVPIRDLADDYYDFDEKNYCLIGRQHGVRYTLGDKVRVQVARADLDRKQLDFALIDDKGNPSKAFHPSGYNKPGKRHEISKKHRKNSKRKK